VSNKVFTLEGTRRLKTRRAEGLIAQDDRMKYESFLEPFKGGKGNGKEKD